MMAYTYGDRRTYVPLTWSVAAVVFTGVLAAVLTFSFSRSPQPEQLGGLSAPPAVGSSEEASPSASADAPTKPAAAPTEAASAACTTALARADAVAQRATALQQALAEHTRIMDELLAQRVTTEQALDETLPVLTRGATERDHFEDELAAYESSRGACTD